jgi:hypothetical protein
MRACAYVCVEREGGVGGSAVNNAEEGPPDDVVRSKCTVE